MKRVEKERLAPCAKSTETIEFDEIVVNEMLFHFTEVPNLVRLVQ